MEKTDWKAVMKGRADGWKPAEKDVATWAALALGGADPRAAMLAGAVAAAPGIFGTLGLIAFAAAFAMGFGGMSEPSTEMACAIVAVGMAPALMGKRRVDWLPSFLMGLAIVAFCDDASCGWARTASVLTGFPYAPDPGSVRGQMEIIVAATVALATEAGSALVGRGRAKAIVLSACALPSFVNVFVFGVTGKAFKISDLKLASTAAEVVGMALPSGRVVARGVAFAIVWAVGATLLWRKGGKGKTRPTTAAACAAIVAISLAAQHANVLGMIRYDLNSSTGFLASFAISSGDGIRRATASEEFKEPKSLGKATASKDSPDVVIAVMVESFSDLSVWPGASSAAGALGNFERLSESFPSGTVWSSTVGNGTVSAEYSFLTGIPTALVGSGGDVYQATEAESVPSLASAFEEAGYSTVGLHPYFRDGYARESFWTRLGFDKMEFLEEFDDSDTIRGLVSDESLFDRIAEEATSGGKKFIFAVTMQNHAGYDEEFDADPFVTDDGKSWDAAGQYLELERITDEALGKLIERLELDGVNETLIVFGDHQPMLGSDFWESAGMGTGTEEEELERRHATPYLIWSDAEGSSVDAPEETSANYLGAVLERACGITDPRMERLGSLLSGYSAITDNFRVTADGTFEAGSLGDEVGSVRNPEETGPLADTKRAQLTGLRELELD